MHNPDKIRDFIERRSKGESFDLIASEIGVARSTLFEWNKKYGSKVLRSAHDDITDCRRFDIDDLQTSMSFAEFLQNRLGISIKSSLHDLKDITLDRQISLWFKIQHEMDRMVLRQRKQKVDLLKHLDEFPDDTNPDQFLDDALSPSRAVEPAPDISAAQLAEMHRQAQARLAILHNPNSPDSPISPISPILSVSAASTQPFVPEIQSEHTTANSAPTQSPLNPPPLKRSI